jgi:hypothetical protein
VLVHFSCTLLLCFVWLKFVFKTLNHRLLLLSPSTIVLLPNAVLEYGSNRLQVFSADGELLFRRTDLGLTNTPTGKRLVWNNEERCLAVANGRGNGILVFA